MIGKLPERGSARKSPAERGAKGAMLGYGAAALARRSVPALAALAVGGWAWRKWRDTAPRATRPILRTLRRPEPRPAAGFSI